MHMIFPFPRLTWPCLSASLLLLLLASASTPATADTLANQPLPPPASDCMVGNPTTNAAPPAPANPLSSTDACHLHTLVRAALAAGQWLQAELLLERLLMLHPNDGQALLQLAQLMASQGRVQSARALIAALAQDQRTPPAHRQRLHALLAGSDAIAPQSAQQAALDAAAHNPSAPRTQLIATLGYSTNPLALPHARSLTFTLPGGDITLPLAERPRSAATFNTLVHQRWDSGLELLLASQSAALAQASTGARLALAGPIALPLSDDAPLRSLHWSLSTQRALDTSARHSASLLALVGAWRWQLSYFQESANARRGLQLRTQRNGGPWRWPGGPAQGEVWLEAEHNTADQPHALRAGIQGQWRIAPRWQWQAYLYAQHDLAGYSPWLAHGQKRQLATAYLALEHQWAPSLWGGHLTTSAYLSQRISNLPLFAWRDTGITLGWRRSW